MLTKKISPKRINQYESIMMIIITVAPAPNLLRGLDVAELMMPQCSSFLLVLALTTNSSQIIHKTHSPDPSLSAGVF